ncbi:hypothetical protein IMZ31_19230 (plasmid) [Pontibacillus sp. ALD_SL1]|uniref:hypothetical protein n=1 Tax=Pontibacillus sp. ALD_SL1 TaxID=2777185 RepID=UPI001A97C446|nr:hypothetical protein [Pontibacillus sp. ALD_SL1]QST02684.1 hypothetical protein IMZ31_19230 [Pontibacillus sp. ALD_SL1]
MYVNQRDFVFQQIQAYAEEQGINLSDEQIENATNGVDYWLTTTIPESISDAISYAKEE